MEYFVQQLINGLTLGSIYGLIAIGYTMVYGIIGMINFAHGDIFMLGGFAALIIFLVLTSIFVGLPIVILLLVMMAAAMLTATPGDAPGNPAELRDALLATASCRSKGLTPLLDHAFTLYPLEQTLSEVIAPCLAAIGDGWARGELTVGQEHLTTAAVRARLERTLTETRGAVRGVGVLACAPGELHEIGLLMLARLTLPPSTPLPEPLLWSAAICCAVGAAASWPAMSSAMTFENPKSRSSRSGRFSEKRISSTCCAASRLRTAR